MDVDFIPDYDESDNFQEEPPMKKLQLYLPYITLFKN